MSSILVIKAENIAREIGVGKDSIGDLVASGELAAWKEGPGKGVWRAMPEDLKDFVKRRRDRHVKKMQ